MQLTAEYSTYIIAAYFVWGIGLLYLLCSTIVAFIAVYRATLYSGNTRIKRTRHKIMLEKS